MMDLLLPLDTELFLWLNSFHNPFWDNIMFTATKTLSSLPLYLFLVYLMFREWGWQQALFTLVFVGFVIAISDQGSVHLFKNAFERLRPSHNPDLEGIVHLVNNKHGGRFSFVSSHAANTFATATFISLIFKRRWLWLVMFVWATFISYTRIYLGLHYPGDILGGAAFGALVGLVFYRLYLLSKNRCFGSC